MCELPELSDVKAAWLNQPEEDIPVDIEPIHRRRTWELFSTTRSEIISSIGAALFDSTQFSSSAIVRASGRSDLQTLIDRCANDSFLRSGSLLFAPVSRCSAQPAAR